MTSSPSRRGRIKPADPFDLIRWLARSQSDARKAVAEFVQNSIDAGSKRIEIIRERRGGIPMLRVLDDGRGVFPDMPSREEALVKIATNIGRSHKLGLTAAERARQVGRYAIGILGVWSAGRHFEMRSSVDGQGVLALRLTEDHPEYHVHALKGRLPLEGTWTEIRVSSLHASALRVLTGRRLADYLAAELRGQILENKLSITVEDRLGRGRTEKRIRLEPPPFRGTPIGPPQVSTLEGEMLARLHLFHVPEDERELEKPRVGISSQGSLVVEDLTLLAEFAHEPWTLGVIEGNIECGRLSIPPGTRRGIVPDAVFLDFVDRLTAIEPDLISEIAMRDSTKKTVRQEELLGELRKAFREVALKLPHYDLLPSTEAAEKGRATDASSAAPDGGTIADATTAADPAPESSRAAMEPDKTDTSEEWKPAAPLLPPAQLASVEIRPRRARIGWGGEKKFRAYPVDINGNEASGEIEWTWTCEELPGAVLEVREAEVLLKAGSGDATGKLRVVARSTDLEASATAAVRVTALAGSNLESGVPEPALVSEPNENWRSRRKGTRWEVNSAHPDYRSTVVDGRRRLRYMAALFAKEMVHATYGDSHTEPLLERLVEILTAVDLPLSRPTRGRAT